MARFARTLSLAALLLGPLSQAAPTRAAEPPAHAEAACATCHDGRGWTLQDGNSAACSGCHATPRNAFHREVRGRCASCHSFHDPDRLRLQGESLARTDATPSESPHCVACHRDGKDPRDLSEGHRAAGAWYHARASKLAYASPSDACLACHARGGQLPVESDAAPPPPRFHAGASHPYGARFTRAASSGVAFRLRVPEDPRVPLVDGRIECITCHDLYSNEDDKLARFDTRAQLCAACHVRVGQESEKLVLSR